MRIKVLCAFLSVCAMASPEATASSENPVEIFVSAASSSGNGTAEAPFPDLQSAVNHIRAIRTGDGAKAVDVTVTRESIGSPRR